MTGNRLTSCRSSVARYVDDLSRLTTFQCWIEVLRRKEWALRGGQSVSKTDIAPTDMMTSRAHHSIDTELLQ